MLLHFVQEENSKHGSCACYLDDDLIDGCDMNKELSYTQAHLVYARVRKKYPEQPIEIQITPALNGPGVYSIEEIKNMGELLINNSLP
jgi:hypothetical protein